MTAISILSWDIPNAYQLPQNKADAHDEELAPYIWTRRIPTKRSLNFGNEVTVTFQQNTVNHLPPVDPNFTKNVEGQEQLD